jgi:hypothetical protein
MDNILGLVQIDTDDHAPVAASRRASYRSFVKIANRYRDTLTQLVDDVLAVQVLPIYRCDAEVG